MRFAVGAWLGIALHGSIRAWLDTAPVFATTAGWIVLTVLITVAVGCWLLLAHENTRLLFDDLLPPLAPLGVFLIVQTTYLGAFQSLST